MAFLDMKLEGRREYVQRIKVLVPLRHLSFNLNVLRLRRCRTVGYSDEELPLLEKTIFLDTWDINSSKD
jgi:hypothetical protein